MTERTALVDGDTLRLGFPGDGGLGARLADEVQRGAKTATCLPASELTPSELDAALGSRGRRLRVVDGQGLQRCTVEVVDAYLATLDQPGDQLLAGEGYGGDVDRFCDDHYAPPSERFVLGAAFDAAAGATLAALGPAYGAAVALHDGLGWSVNDVALATGVPAEEVRQRLRRGRVRLRSLESDGRIREDTPRVGAAAEVTAPADRLADELAATHALRRPLNRSLPIVAVLWRLVDGDEP